MASSLGKRIKTLGSKDQGTKRKEKEQFYCNKFRTTTHERYFPTVEGRRMLMEGEQCLYAMSMMEGVDYDEGLNINIGQVIADEIQSCVRDASNKAPPGHPSLITHLCEITVDELGQPVPPPQQPMELLRILTSAFPERQFISQEDFAAQVAWPVDPTHEGGSVEAAKASTMDEDFEDEDDEDEEAEEEKDSNDDE
ncbi:hypothetical protein LR48_Vigan06g094200 [Vigna angularis]|uniref:Uncharacterized protein n=1 Tax=Phaseolus angularis TaxID=3914 RepID=A0A0L9USD2_PHAAN|nr:hypothetical protein LR48_Vigan06g094200 [Vigna angularis]